MAVTPKKAAVKKRVPTKKVPAALPEKQAPAEVETEEDPVVKKSWFASFWPYGIMIAIALVLVAIVLWPKPKPKPAQPDNTEIIRQKDSTIAALGREAALQEELKNIHKATAEEYLKKPIQNNTYYVESKKKYDQIPSDVRALNKRQLHNEITELTRDTAH